MRVARGSGRHPLEVHDLLEEYKKMEKIWGKMKGLKMNKRGAMNPQAHGINAAQISKALPPHMLQQLGGMHGIQDMMKKLSTMDMGGLGFK